MPHFTITVSFKGDSDQKLHWENVTKELQDKGARILDVQSKAGRVGEPLTTVNIVTRAYKAPKRIKFEGQTS